ncbi:hypothetical protein ZIOFF_001595 [Zingiber officinale]|uniref:Uncharacterized protein n=1 Tax=Zingiber officinale TaxID=94328 RepID=A0A8J5M8Q5_ZINOF|nr:hypothetical protein ZIOFF_001595 [Zingiber officinale]
MLEDDLRIPELVWRWKDLEHLEMETKPSSFLEAVAEIGRNCPRFVGLKVCGLIGREDAKVLERCLSELKHLELSKSYLTKDELLVVIGGCRKLETLTIKDCLGFQADDEILKLVSRIERFEHEGSTLLDDYGVIVVDNRFMGRKENVLHHLGNPNFEIIRLDLVHPLLLEVDQIYHLACPGLPFTNLKYSRVEIDEVRFEWAECMLDYI